MRHLLSILICFMSFWSFSQQKPFEGVKNQLESKPTESNEEPIWEFRRRKFEMSQGVVSTYFYKDRTTKNIGLGITYHAFHTGPQIEPDSAKTKLSKVTNATRRVSFDYVETKRRRLRDIYVVDMNGTCLMYVLYIGTSDWEQQVYSINLEKCSLELLATKVLTQEELSEQYGHKKVRLNFTTIEFRGVRTVVDQTGIYLVSEGYSYSVESSKGGFPIYSYGPILVTKFGKDGVVWSTFVKRSFRSNRTLEMSENPDELEFKDIEWRGFVDDLERTTKIMARTCVFRYSIDKETGEFSGREIIE